MPQKLHGAIESSFEGPRERRLWRIDRLNGKAYVLILSAAKPDLSKAVSQFGCPDADDSFMTKDYDPLLNRIKAGTVCRFRLTANPVKSCPSADRNGERGTVHAHSTVGFQEKWLLDRAGRNGFALEKDDFSVIGQQWHIFRKGATQEQVRLLAVTYEGRLTVTEPEAFKALLTQGLGHGKAYGMGLMTVLTERI